MICNNGLCGERVEVIRGHCELGCDCKLWQGRCKYAFFKSQAEKVWNDFKHATDGEYGLTDEQLERAAGC